MRNLLANRPDLDPAKMERRRKHMDAAIDDCLIEGYPYTHGLPVGGLQTSSSRSTERVRRDHM